MSAQLLVVLAGLVTLVVVAFAVGPPLLRRHLRSAVGTVSPQLSRHLEDAFLDAGRIALGIGIAAFLTAAVIAARRRSPRTAHPTRHHRPAPGRAGPGPRRPRAWRGWP